MAILGASFSIGRSALSAYQAALAVVGQNIANVGNPDYARQTSRFAALEGGNVYGIKPGNGVRLNDLQRHFDAALEARLRLANGARSGAEVSYQQLSQTEALYNELGEQDISSLLSELYGSFGQLETQPTEAGARQIAISSGDNLIRTMNRVRTGLLRQVSEMNESVQAVADRANELTQQVADLNQRIVGAESDGRSIAAGLRDQRDASLRELGELMDIQTREQPTGAINVYIGSEPLVEFGRSRGIVAESTLTDGLEISEVRFADNHGRIVMQEGRLAALVNARDMHFRSHLDRLDQFARGVIYETNRVHSTGVGLQAWRADTGAYAVDDVNAALNSDDAGLPFPVVNGALIVHVRDTNTGQEITRQIEIDLDGLNGDDTTLQDLADALNSVDGLNASTTADGRLQLNADPDREYYFTDDTSGVLAAVGVAAFFTGVDATTMQINTQVRDNPNLIAASLSGQTQDGSNAGRLALLGEQASGLLGGLSAQDFHAATISNLANDVNGALTAYEANDAVYSNLLAQRESISGVNLDEEAINLAKFERAFQGASRYLAVLDSLADEVLSLAV